ncbi:MAG: 6-bladed beta-propeller [Deltaproteobacteria bacterium]|nr:6-bladed beta-propeller [Deltaproteobacteria bacterium]
MRRMRAVAGTLLFLSMAGRAFAGVSFELIYAVGGYGIGRESFDRPVDVVEDRDENIYVVDQGNNRIEVLDRRGRYLREWGGRGFRPGSFDTPSAIAIDPVSGNLYVVDTLNHRVQKFDPNGKFLGTFGQLGSRDGDFNTPRDVTIDRKGNVYVADTGNDRIQKFDPSGKFLAEWGKFARRRGVELRNPVSVAYSDEGFGYLFALTSPDCRVQKFDIDGNFVAEWAMHRKGEGALCGPSRIRIEPRRYTVYIADTENDRVILFDKDGEPLGDLRGGKVPFKRPGSAFVVQTFGENVLVADTGNNFIQKFRRIR